MSTYNGEKNLKRQVDSIIRQQGVQTEIFIRDDGSSDHTCFVIQELCEEYKGRINYIAEKNIGYKKSFLRLASLAGGYDYYCFADQDDIWEEKKLCHAVAELEKLDDPIRLYASSVKIVDPNLNQIGFNNIQTMPNRLEALFARGRLAGCTFVFTPGLLRLITKFSDINFENSQMPSHDFLTAAVAFACGTVYLDRNSYIKHIRYKNSVTCGGNGPLKRLRVEADNVFFKKNVALHTAQLLLEYNMSYLHPESVTYLQKVVDYKKKLTNRIYLVREPKMTCGIVVCDWETKFKILIGTF